MTEPDAAALQRTLSTEQVEAFYHDLFVEDQTRHFVEMAPRPAGSGVVVDVGGGCGFFARRLQQLTARRVRVIGTGKRAAALYSGEEIDAWVREQIRKRDGACVSAPQAPRPR